MNKKYPQLSGICGQALRNNLCYGCSKLEDINFVGQAECDLVQDPIKKIKDILGIQEKFEI